jgi:predicted permease
MSHTPSGHQRIQLWIVTALTFAYAILATVVGEAPLAALIGLGMTMLSGWLGYSLGRRREGGFEIFLVWFVAS